MYISVSILAVKVSGISFTDSLGLSRSIDIAELFRNSTSQHSGSQSTLPVSSNQDDSSIFSQFQTYQAPSTIPSGDPPKASSQVWMSRLIYFEIVSFNSPCILT